MMRNLAVTRVAIKAAITWRANMLLSIITGPLFVGANYLIWKGLYTASGATTIRGYTFEEMLIYLIISFVTTYLIWDDMESHISKDVRNGSLITYLLRPLSYLKYNFFFKLGHRIVAAIIEFIPVMAIMGALFGWQLILRPTLGYYFASVAIAFVISFLIRSILGMIAFYVVRPRGIIEVYKVFSGFLYGVFLSLALFPPSVQKVFVLLPFQFVAFVPAQMFLGSYELGGIALSPLQVLAYGVLHIIILVAIAMLLWRHAVKRFCGVGT